MKKDESLKRIVESLQGDNLNKEIDMPLEPISIPLNPKYHFAYMNCLDFDILSGKDKVTFENAVKHYVYAWAFLKTKAGGVNISAYGKKVEDLDCFKKQLEGVYEGMAKLGLKTEKQERYFLYAVSFDGRVFWQKFNGYEQSLIRDNIRYEVSEELKWDTFRFTEKYDNSKNNTKASNENDKGSLGDDA